ncbi:DHS-like NAD/FAD-binding domain-containing protein [Gigaspora margarita]|uniref:DHS-like NAD/FAD-binding domain-containing protein n=1 Tax=Gigaspora margarita TaxID=4874 RepID=A0A8H4AEX0_GIGMA|nr:DHS-like NAD/FAD-binding domain-containing protein [Gigaspora margarita]
MEEIVKLNLKSENDCLLIREVNSLVAKAKNCVIITRAGISCSVEIPDFISSYGLYNMIKSQYPELIVNARPTATHSFIKKLADMKKLKRVYTQNIDNLEELVGLDVDWQFERVRNCKAQVVQLHETLSKLRCNACTNICPFTLQYCDIFKEGKAPNCPKCEERENTRVKQGKRSHFIGQLKPTVILYGDTHPKGLEISQIAIREQNKADCLIIMGNSLRIPRVKDLIRDFARAVHGHNGYVILVNAMDVANKGWNGVIDYQIEGTCDEWVKLVDLELLNGKRILTMTKISLPNLKYKQEKKERNVLRQI